MCLATLAREFSCSNRRWGWGIRGRRRRRILAVLVEVRCAWSHDIMIDEFWQGQRIRRYAAVLGGLAFLNVYCREGVRGTFGSLALAPGRCI